MNNQREGLGKKKTQQCGGISSICSATMTSLAYKHIAIYLHYLLFHHCISASWKGKHLVHFIKRKGRIFIYGVVAENCS